MDKEIVMIQEMINDYLKEHGKKTITEMMAEKNQHEVLGILTPAHKMVLQQMIFEYVKSQGRNLNEEIGRNQVLGVMSHTEMQYIDELLEQYQLHKEENKEKVA